MPLNRSTGRSGRNRFRSLFEWAYVIDHVGEQDSAFQLLALALGSLATEPVFKGKFTSRSECRDKRHALLLINTRDGRLCLRFGGSTPWIVLQRRPECIIDGEMRIGHIHRAYLRLGGHTLSFSSVSASSICIMLPFRVLAASLSFTLSFSSVVLGQVQKPGLQLPPGADAAQTKVKQIFTNAFSAYQKFAFTHDDLTRKSTRCFIVHYDADLLYSCSGH